MKIGIIPLVSDIHDPDTINRVSKPIMSELKKSFDLEEIEIGEIHQVCL